MVRGDGCDVGCAAVDQYESVSGEDFVQWISFKECWSIKERKTFLL